MELATFVLKCLPPLHRARHGVAMKSWPHVHRMTRPIIHVWHRAATGPVTRTLMNAQAACRYVPLAAGIAAGGAVLPPAASPPAVVAHTTMVAAPPVSASPSSAMAGDSGSGGGFDAGFPASNASIQALSPAAFAALSPDSPPSSILPISNFVSSPPGAGPTPPSPDLPATPFVPPSLTTIPDSPPQSVPEAPSLAMLLSGIALLALTTRLRRAGK
jgi:hypothetical protein